jgi:hypothetical protein
MYEFESISHIDLYFNRMFNSYGDIFVNAHIISCFSSYFCTLPILSAIKYISSVTVRWFPNFERILIARIYAKEIGS